MKRQYSNMVIVDDSSLDEALADIERSAIVSFDTETSGLDQWAPGGYLTSIGISTKRYDWCFPLNHHRSKIYDDFVAQKKLMRRIDKVMRDKKIVAHNGKFDHLWVRVLFGHVWPIHFDTMLAHYNLDENSRHGLKEITVNLGWDDGYDISLEEKWGKTGSLTRHCDYLAKDTFYTLRLYYLFKKELKKDEDTYNIFNYITMPASKMYCDAEFTGVYIDDDKLQEAKIYWSEKAIEARKRLDILCPSKSKWKNSRTKEWEYGVNWGSPKQLAEILFNQLKLTVLDKTPKGEASTSESVLLRLAREHEIPKLVLQYREACKNLNTFIEPWERQMVDNRIHPTFKIHGTVTGRPSCAEPNLQQVPRDPRIRSLITAPDGWVLMDVDYSQAELRIAAEMSMDSGLMTAYKTGQDVHSKTVEEIFNIKAAKQTKEERKKGKAINFGFIYGMFPKKFTIYARDNYDTIFTEDEAAQVRKKFFRAYPGLLPWHETQIRFANYNGYVRSLLGRMRRLPDAMRQPSAHYDKKKSEAERQAINSPVQSFASDLTLMSAIQIHNEFDHSYLRVVGTVHDSILMECRIDMVEKVAPKILKIMKRPKLLDELNVKLSVELVGELEIGAWASGKVWHPKA